jgi:N-acetylmuramoyl-L-alanine amidase
MKLPVIRPFVIGLFFLVSVYSAQTLQQCKKRFDSYLNFRSSLDKRVVFTKDAIYLLDAKGKKELAIYANEINVLAKFLENGTVKDQETFIKTKKLKKYTQQQLDSLISTLKNKRTYTKQQRLEQEHEEKQEGIKQLNGFRIALDPGHFSTTLEEALVEQKYLFFTKQNTNKTIDTIKLFESVLTFNTAKILQKMLEENGAEVYLTRNAPNHTSFDCTFTDWMKNHKKRVLDSLKNEKVITPQKYLSLLKSSDHKFFWDFFRDYDLANRSNKINNFSPHLTLIIHYNVDEKNKPWDKHTSKNFTMAFIGGAFVADNLDRPGNQIDFLRLLLTDHLDRSQEIAKETVVNFNKNLDIPIAKQGDADYLRDNCLLTSSPGVFCRNLALCRRVNSPLVYGESLYQDNEHESAQLMLSDVDIYGVQANKRLVKVAVSYYSAILKYLNDYYLKG